MKHLTYLLVVIILLPSCATIVGGSKYYAHIVVNENPKAAIIYQGEQIGLGSATIAVKRRDSNKLAFSVKQDGCETKQYKYATRTIRGWSILGSLVTWTLTITSPATGTIFIPVGLVVDLATGAFYKPNVMERGVSKMDYKNFKYRVDYSSCSVEQKTETKPQLIDVVYLKNGSIIKGIIMEQIPNESIKIQTKDGSLFVFKMEEVEKITKEESK